MNPIIIEDYNPLWPERFKSIRTEIAAALDGLFAAIEHIGSTAVPGLAAKPVIDMDVLLKKADDLSLVIQKLTPLGYRHQGNLGIAGREAFQTPPDTFPHHLYVCLPDSEEYQRHIAFRDYLRGHPAVATDYAALKRELATKYAADRDEYARAKSHFVMEVLLTIRSK
jgi:GrpB-like predicted nucleotidyltransferase (UPF0157 family)